MKKVKLFFIAAAMTAIIACGGPDHEAERSVKDLRTYVDSIERDHANYYLDENYWPSVERGYEEKKLQVDAKSARMNEKLKKEYEELQQKYAALKDKYETEHSKALEADKTMKTKMTLRRSLFGEGVASEDMSFNFMNAGNAASVYQTFVDIVAKNSVNYTTQDWEEIKALYDAMNVRKDEIENELSTKDKNKITGLKIKFSTIKSIDKPLSKEEPGH